MGAIHRSGAGSSWFELDLAAARVALGLTRCDALPAAAIAAMVAGADGPQLTRLAGMGGASESEISAQLLLVYPDERGDHAPTGAQAAELVASNEIRSVADGTVTDIVSSFRRLYALWAAAGYSDGVLADLALFSDRYDLAVQGVIGEPSTVLAEFADACQIVVDNRASLLGDTPGPG